MKNLFSKVMIVIAGVATLFGISANNVMAITSVPDISGKSALYLEHGKSISHHINVYNDHESHASHASHASHSSGY